MIPLSIPFLTGNEKKYVDECLDTNWISSVGRFVVEFEKRFSEYTSAPYATAVSSGTAALHLALIVSGIKEKDEVFVPSLTFIAPVNAVSYTGAVPVFIDSDEESLGISPDAVKSFIDANCEFKKGILTNKISGRTIKALIAVHIIGHSCRMDELKAIASQYNLTLIEDCAEGAGCLYKGKHVGNSGDFGCFSFNGNKVLTTGGGGMTVTSDKSACDMLKHLSTQAKSDELYYSHDMVGYNYRMTNVTAAIGLGQLEHLEEMIEKKRSIQGFYENEFKNMKNITLFKEQPWCRSNYWFGVVFVPEAKRDPFIKHMLENGIQVRPFWKPNHLHLMFAACPRGSMETTEKIWKKGVCIPCFQGMSECDMRKTADTIKNFFN